MKRSEIFNKINNILKKDLSPTKSLLLANEILKSIEDSGMSPPQIFRKLTETELNYLNSIKGFRLTPDEVVTRNEWEDEV